MSAIDRTFEVGKLYCDRGDFKTAIGHLKEASQGYFADKNFSGYLKAINLLLRIYAEMEMFDEIHQAKEKLQDLVLKEGFELSSKTYYTLAVCAAFKDQSDTALDYLQKALSIALASDNKEDICYAIFGLAAVYARPTVGRYADALKEIYNLEVFFQVYHMPELKLACEVLNADILIHLKKYEEAIEVLWRAYDQIKATKNLTAIVNLQVLLGRCHLEMGDKEMARLYLGLAKRAVDAENLIRMAKRIDKYLEKLGGESQNSFDLVFDESNHAVVERKIGRIDFKNQFILLDLLRLFMQNQGVVYSKEYLVENVWKQAYDPAVHDNKIYVTIKRLRKLIEPDYEKPKYIFRAKNGYYMNKSARVSFDH
ncbi:winged helix-turn-helix domain-containing protein [Bdellovibrio sp. HCB337]|uniref:winged helix-turn-helix domain-containing protein n=1 Tax=Bdellovibrio sp. HCB337 TaxID=3394358 RepID=UPI0039A70763